MGFMRGFIDGQKSFFLDLFAVINIILLFFAYFFGIGASSLLLRRKESVKMEGGGFWEDLPPKERDPASYLDQF